MEGFKSYTKIQKYFWINVEDRDLCTPVCSVQTSIYAKGSSPIPRYKNTRNKLSKTGLEPVQISPHAPQTCASTIPPLRHIFRVFLFSFQFSNYLIMDKSCCQTIIFHIFWKLMMHYDRQSQMNLLKHN